jgi:hypothetical protein
MHHVIKSALLALPLVLSACVAPSARPPARPVRPPPAPVVVRPPAYSPIGLEAVMGKTAATLQSQFGRPDLDVQEGTGRKLQFGDAICILDAYLYPPPRGGEPVVTYLDARLPDGRDMDRASCVAALSRRRESN